MPKIILAFIASILYICTGLYAHANSTPKGTYYLSGIVRDASNAETLPFASVTVEGEANGTLSNEKGIFELTVPDSASALAVSCLGYEKCIIPIKKGKINIYDVSLSPASTELKEIVVKRKKYTKKNNPAVDFARRLRTNAPDTDPRRNEYYNYDKHELTTLALNDFDSYSENSNLLKQFPFLKDYADTSEISGKTILNLLVKEKTSQVHYRKTPHADKEVVTGIRQEGMDEMFDKDNFMVVLDDMLSEVDLFSNDINILHNRFVSPLSRIAPDFYKFYLTDTVEVAGDSCIVLSFYPHNTASFGFNGQVFVPVNDSTMFIKKVTMRTPRNINLNFIQNLYISQEYGRAPDGSRIKLTDDLTIEAKMMPGTPGMYLRRNMAFDNHNFSQASDTTVYDALASKMVVDMAKNRDDEFWSQNRLITVTDNEKHMGAMMQQLRGVPLFYWGEKVAKLLFVGYITTGKDSKVDIGPVNTMVSFNSIEGTRLRAGGFTTANLNKRIFGRGYLAYGIKDHKWKYGAELEYSFIDKEYHSREFPIHSIRLSSSYDLDQIGEHYLYTNQDNIFLSLKRMKANNTTYHLVNKLEYNLELHNNFSVNATLQNDRQIATRYLPFIDGYGNDIPHYTENAFILQLRYAPGEKFAQGKSYRVPINHDAPVFTLTHTIAPKGLWGAKFFINKTEASFQKRFWLSMFGYIDTEVRGGHVWSRSPFLNLMIPNANLSYTIQKGSFALMNPMEFINDSYVSWDLTYWLNGALFNAVPGFKKLKLREVIGFKGLYGHLSDNNNPSLHPELLRFPTDVNITPMKDRPYMEISAGIDNIFKILRVDYVWRLTYRNMPYSIDRNGLRVSLHMRF